MANRPWYKQTKFWKLVFYALIFVAFVLNGIYKWIDFESLRQYLTW